MEHVDILIRKPGVQDYCRLRKACGWPVPETSVCEAAIRNSVFGVVATLNGETIGMGRVVGDGSLWNYIQDVIVLPEYQRKGQGKRLMETIMAQLAKTAASGSDVALISAPGMAGFYERFGFSICKPDKPAMRRKL